MGDLKVETEALLRDNNFGSDEFSDALLKSIGWEDWSVASQGEALLASRRDFRQEVTFTVDPQGTKELENAFHFKSLPDGKVEIGVHVADIAHFVKANSLVDREAKKRGTAVYLVDRLVNLLPQRISTDLCSLLPGEDRLTVSVVFTANPETGAVDDDVWIGKGIIKSSGRLSYDEADAVIKGTSEVASPEIKADTIRALYAVSSKFREARYGNRTSQLPPLRLLYQVDDENVPVRYNIFDASPVQELVEELSHKANFFVARKIVTALPDKAFLRRQPSPNARRLQTLVERMNRLGFGLDPTSSGTLQSSLCKVQDDNLRQGMETLLVKAMQRAKYYVASPQDEQRQHFTLNLPVYTHFTNPSRRYADILVHRQLEAALSDGAVEFSEDLESLNKTADLCNNKKDSAHNAQEQSVHIEACREMDKKRQEIGEDGSVINPAQRNSIVGVKPTVGLTSRAGVIPESLHQDTIGTFGKTVRDAVYALDAIYGIDQRDNYTLAQKGKTPNGGYAQFLTNKTALKGAIFGLPWESFWSLGDPDQISQLLELVDLIKEAGATVINGTELPHYKTIVSPDGWNWDYGGTRGFANESEYTYIKADFYNNLRDYLAEVNNTNIKSVEDLVQYNLDNYGSEGGYPNIHPAFGSGQDGLIASLESKGIMNETYFQALEFCQRTTREEGIDAALKYKNQTLDGLLVPPDVAQSIQIAAQAGYPAITVPAGVGKESGMPYGLAILNTAFSEPTLVRYASAIEDLQKSTGTKWQRSLPEWRGYLVRNLPVIM